MESYKLNYYAENYCIFLLLILSGKIRLQYYKARVEDRGNGQMWVFKGNIIGKETQTRQLSLSDLG